MGFGADGIALDNPPAASALVQRLFEHVEQLQKHPEGGSKPAKFEGWRYRQFVEQPCRVFYRYIAGTVFVLHVTRSERRLEQS